MTALSLSSSAFDDGERIPDKYGYTEANINPPLSIDGVPPEAESLVLIVDDPDAKEPAGKIWNHWLVWDIDPDRTEIPEDWSPETATEGQNDYAEHGYGGPNPPDREHTYRFRLYAIDTTAGLPNSASKDDLIDEITGHSVDKASLTGTYAP
jgi:Raf kinase inhibitor-like YbhB/YbcL family protein